MKPKYQLARKQRRALTTPEFLIWQRIKLRQENGPIFRRQYALGPYILDFYCILARFDVEIDGHHHNLDSHIMRDNLRDEYLASQNILTYRIQAAEVFIDADGVADGIVLLASERLKKAPTTTP